MTSITNFILTMAILSSIPGCLTESADPDGMPEEQQPVPNDEVLDTKSGTTNLSSPASCIGYTDGGGQRVIGNIAIDCDAVVDLYGNYGYPGQVVTQTSIKTSATNQAHGVLGWTNKRTGQLLIQGSITVVAPFGSGTYNVYTSSNGELVTYVDETIWQTNWYPQQCGTVPVSFNGTLDFYGRHGSHCNVSDAMPMPVPTTCSMTGYTVPTSSSCTPLANGSTVQAVKKNGAWLCDSSGHYANLTCNDGVMTTSCTTSYGTWWTTVCP